MRREETENRSGTSEICLGDKEKLARFRRIIEEKFHLSGGSFSVAFSLLHSRLLIIIVFISHLEATLQIEFYLHSFCCKWSHFYSFNFQMDATHIRLAASSKSCKLRASKTFCATAEVHSWNLRLWSLQRTPKVLLKVRFFIRFNNLLHIATYACSKFKIFKHLKHWGKICYVRLQLSASFGSFHSELWGFIYVWLVLHQRCSRLKVFNSFETKWF